MKAVPIPADKSRQTCTHINIDAKHLRRFLNSCDGNWHNCIHISCTSCQIQKSCPEQGFLFHPDNAAIPLLLPLTAAENLFSCHIEPEECLCSLTMTQFLSMYGDYIKKQQYPDNACCCMAMLKAQEDENYDW